MITEFGKCLRRIRLESGSLLKSMADALNITPAYLSSVENGKRKPTRELLAKLCETYDFDCDTKDELFNSFSKTINEITIDTSNTNENQSNLGLVFARKINTLSEEQIKAISNLLNN